jgi:hypothetical protein
MGCFKNCKALSQVAFESPSSMEPPLRIEDNVFKGTNIHLLTNPHRAVPLSGHSLRGLSAFSLEPNSPCFSMREDGSLYFAMDPWRVLIRASPSNVPVFFVPNDIKVLDRGCFIDLQVLEVRFQPGPSVTIFEEEAFSHSKLIKIHIPASVTDIEKFCFYRCRDLQEVTFEPNSHLTTIGRWAFALCDNLRKIRIPASVTSMYEEPDVLGGCFHQTPIKITFERDGSVVRQFDRHNRGGNCGVF